MSTSLSLEAKVNDISLTNESKNFNSLTWVDHTETEEDATGTWDTPGVPIIKETKVNSITLSLETRT